MTKLTPEISLSVSPDLASPDLESLRDWIRAHRVDEIECVTPDFAGIARGKVMPAAKFLRESEIRLPVSIYFAGITGEYADVDHPELYSDGDITLTPDLTTARAVPWAGDPSLQIIHDVVDRHGVPIPFAPREVLRRVLRAYEAKGWTPVVAPELEFYLTKPNTDPDYPLEPPVGRSGRQSTGSQAFSLSAVDEYDSVIEHIYDYAEAQGLEIDTIIQEAGAAQLEVNMMHGDAMKLADQVFLFKRLIREAALRCGSYATFMAKPMARQPGSAMHVHQSVLDREGRNIFTAEDGEPSPLFGHFIGGQQKYLPACSALSAPYVNSYRRMVKYMSAPVNLEWGYDNRSTGLRAPRSDPKARRVENRVTGADANPYLALAGSLAAGFLGMVEAVEPRPAVTGGAYDNERDLPYSLLEAVDLLQGCAPLTALLGEDFVKIYATLKQFEYDQFMTVISPWEREHLLLNV
ncbi:glutamine synthetase family protein [Albimonas sp. CAU 1670]|uniref:glutamine synthetase family protein n=1 Tax=Albimonas sp. CAU 1670 TaxID=3032599 RepID=UPI0023D97F41|nr:glutamine synthetase family protein [Albimonas sp. CAU 1670]MDF2232057.1 glutamine synthetase family protein [Albimonas sp. CAU 1670]